MKQLFSVLFAGAALAALPAHTPAADRAAIGDAGSGNRGVTSVNQSAGNLNQQANLRTLAVSSWGVALASTPAGQFQSDNEDATPAAPAHASIDGSAFARSTGMLGINQTAGNANQSSNQVAIAISAHGAALAQTADETLLAAATAGSHGGGKNPSGQNSVAISDQAFQGTSGVVQVNQVAGAWNHSANLLAVRFAHQEGN